MTGRFAARVSKNCPPVERGLAFPTAFGIGPKDDPDNPGEQRFTGSSSQGLFAENYSFESACG